MGGRGGVKVPLSIGIVHNVLRCCPVTSLSSHHMRCENKSHHRQSRPEEALLHPNLSPLRLRHRLEEHAAGQTPAAARKERTANPGRRWGVWSIC